MCACVSVTHIEVWFADLAPLQFSTHYYLPYQPAICFYYPGEYVCLRISIIISKAMTLSRLLLHTKSKSSILSCTQGYPQFIFWLHAVCIFKCVSSENQIFGDLVYFKQCSQMQYKHTHTKFHSHCPWLMPWLNVCSPITDSNYRQSPCVSITSQHNALIRPGLI